jgi:hypothetical protein
VNASLVSTVTLKITTVDKIDAQKAITAQAAYNILVRLELFQKVTNINPQQSATLAQLGITALTLKSCLARLALSASKVLILGIQLMALQAMLV